LSGREHGACGERLQSMAAFAFQLAQLLSFILQFDEEKASRAMRALYRAHTHDTMTARTHTHAGGWCGEALEAMGAHSAARFPTALLNRRRADNGTDGGIRLRCTPPARVERSPCGNAMCTAHLAHPLAREAVGQCDACMQTMLPTGVSPRPLRYGLCGMGYAVWFCRPFVRRLWPVAMDAVNVGANPE
jgi:hypothetical protein